MENVWCKSPHYDRKMTMTIVGLWTPSSILAGLSLPEEECSLFYTMEVTTVTAIDPNACLFYTKMGRYRTEAQYLYLRGFREAGRANERKARDDSESMTQLL